MIQVHRVAHGQHGASQADDVSVLNLFRRSTIGKFYLRRLRQYAPIRKTAIWGWKHLIKFIHLKFKPLKFKQLTAIVHNRLLVHPKQKVSLGKPSVYPNEKSSNIKISASYEFPEIFVTTIADAMVIGSSNFVHTNQAIIGHNLFRISHDYTSEELHGRLYVNAKKQLVTRLSSIETDMTIDQGALFTDAVSTNYAHFMTELLPKVFVYTQSHPNKATPLIIDYELHINLMQALEMVVGEDAQLIGLEKGEPLQVKSLQVVSSCGYVPFGRRPHTNHFSDHSHGIFSPSVLLGMRDLIKSKVATLSSNTEANVTHKKIWIKRNSTYRNVSNTDEIQSALITQGFMVIEPEKLSFVEQVTIFSNADMIVGATGAAFANLIFCKPETKIIILISELKDTSYGYWQNMACTVDNRVTYVLGVTQNSRDDVHADFSVDLNDLMASIK
ncbi:glycosyltransferase family 61 protein [Porticoccus sp. Uisw_050_02]|uniref:glycosyltransferase family 61 protein n=1 Tax=Porticoccus sp. Uisw_050_02 TaxID=3230978 RepID=UPI0039EB456C